MLKLLLYIRVLGQYGMLGMSGGLNISCLAVYLPIKQFIEHKGSWGRHRPPFVGERYPGKERTHDALFCGEGCVSSLDLWYCGSKQSTIDLLCSNQKK